MRTFGAKVTSSEATLKWTFVDLEFAVSAVSIGLTPRTADFRSRFASRAIRTTKV
jgi:hypothetical protein